MQHASHAARRRSAAHTPCSGLIAAHVAGSTSKVLPDKGDLLNRTAKQLAHPDSKQLTSRSPPSWPTAHMNWKAGLARDWRGGGRGREASLSRSNRNPHGCRPRKAGHHALLPRCSGSAEGRLATAHLVHEVVLCQLLRRVQEGVHKTVQPKVGGLQQGQNVRGRTPCLSAAPQQRPRSISAGSRRQRQRQQRHGQAVEGLAS